MALNVTTSAGLTAEMKTFYDKVLLQRLLPKLAFLKHGQKRPIPKRGGKTIEFRKFLSLNTTDLASVAVEGVPPELQDLTVTALTATVKEYIRGVGISEILQLTAIDPVLTEAVELLGEQMGEILDRVTRDILLGTTSVYNVGGGLAVNNITAANKLTADEVLKVWTLMRRDNVPTYEGGYYLMFCAPEQIADVMRDPLWQNVNIYNNGGNNIEKGEIGRIHGFRFIDTTLVEPVTNSGGVNVYSGLAVGKNAYGIVDIDGRSKPEVILKLANGDTSDKTDYANQKSTAATKALFTAVILNNLSIKRVNSAATAA